MEDFENNDGQFGTPPSDSDFGGGNPADDNSNSDNGAGGVSDFAIPDEYKEKDWAKGFDGKVGDELKSEIFKTLDEKYSNAPVVPETVEDYALNELEFKNENGETTYTYPQEVLEHFGNEFKEIGLTKEQAHGLLNKYTNFELEQFQAMTNIDDLNKNLDEMFKTNPTQKQEVQSLLKEFLPQEDQEFLQNAAPNVTIEMFYKVAKGFIDKYGFKEGAGGQGNRNNFRMSQEDKDKEYNRIVGEMEALQRRPHTTEEKDNLQRQLNNLFK